MWQMLVMDKAYGVTVSGSLAYVADASNGLQIIDVTDPSLPKLSLSYDTPGEAVSVTVSGSIVYVADGGSGLQILDFSKVRYELSFTPDASIAGNYEWTLIGSNDLGATAESIFSFRIEGAPLVTGTLPIQVAFVDRIFSTVVSQDVFTDPNDDALTFKARQIGGSLLPKWLDFSPTGTFLGTPGGSDVGFLNISINANDGHMGQASVDMGLTVTHAPTVVKSISNQLADVGVPFSYSVDKGTFIDLDQDAMIYASRLNTGQPLPSWLKFDPSTLLFSGTPIGFSSLDIEVQAIESHGGKTSTYFNLLAENFPKGVKQIPDLLVGVQVPFSYQLPTDLFIDADKDILAYRMADFQGNSIPNWLSFNPLALTLSGTPIAAPSPLKLKLIARDRYGAEGDLDWNLIIDYFPSLNPKYTFPKQVVNLGTFWQLSLPTDLFIDQDDPTLTLTATQNDLPLSSWISFQNNLFSGTPEALSKSVIKITATDSKGAKISSSFDLTVDQFPKVLEVPPQVIAAIGKSFSYTLPSSTFDSASLTLKAMQLKSNQKFQALESTKELPLWLKFDEGKRLFTGTPALSDAGNMTIQVTATDVEGGFATVLFPIYTTYVPTFEKKIPDMQAKVGHFFNWRLGNGTLINLSNRNTTLELEQVQGLPNHWLTLEGEELFGTPNGSDIGVTQMNLVANDGIATTKDPFTVEVIDNQTPQFASRMSDQLIEVLEPFQFSLPSVMFKDDDGDPLALSVTMQDGSPIPEWIKFNKETLTFRGTAPRDATNNFSVREYEFLVSASDGQKSTDGSFRLKVGGASTLQKVLEYVGYGLTALSFIVAAYRKRALIWKFLGKKIYTAPSVNAVIGREFNHQLSKRVVACFVIRMDDQQEIPLDEFFHKELSLDGKKRSIRGVLSLENRGEYTIVAYNWFGVRSRLFVINIDTEEELNKMIRGQNESDDLESGIELQEIKMNPVPQLALKEPVSEEKTKAAKVIQRAWRKSKEKVKPWNTIDLDYS